jgi:acyl transferase domain-containing protein
MRVSGDVAVVGIAYKLPQDIENDAAFWEVLRGAKNLSSEWPERRSRQSRSLPAQLLCNLVLADHRALQ